LFAFLSIIIQKIGLDAAILGFCENKKESEDSLLFSTTGASTMSQLILSAAWTFNQGRSA
jgi:hypothetical protein